MKPFFLIFILFIASFFYAPNAMALKRAVFPDSSTLQPMPTNVHSNISGNINSHVNQNQPGQNSSNSDFLPTGASQNYNKSNLENNRPALKNILHSDNFLWWIILLMIIIFVAALVLYFRKKPKKIKRFHT